MKKVIVTLILILILALAMTIAYASGSATAEDTLADNNIATCAINGVSTVASVRSGNTIGTLSYTGSTFKTQAYIHAKNTTNGQYAFHLEIGDGNGDFKYDISFKIYNSSGSLIGSKDFVKDPINGSKDKGKQFDLITTNYSDGDYRFSWSGTISRISGSANPSGSYNFTIDNTKPSLKTDIKNNAVVNHAVDFAVNDAHPYTVWATVSVPDEGYVSAYEEATLRLPTSAEIALKKVLQIMVQPKDQYGNYGEQLNFTYDPIAPTIDFKRADNNANISNGDLVNCDVVLSYSDNLSMSSAILEKYNGTGWQAISMPTNQKVTESGQYRLTATDAANNKTSKTFLIDKTRAYISNASVLQSIFGFSNEIRQGISDGNFGDSETINLGYTAQAFNININNHMGNLDYVNKLTVSGTFKEYKYSHGEKTVLNAIAYNNNQSFNKFGEYQLIITNAVGLKLKIRFEIDITTIPNWSNSKDFISLGSHEYLVYKNKNIVNLSTEDYNRGARISVNGTIYNAVSLSYSKLVELVKDDKISVDIVATNIASAVNSAIFYIDETAPNIDNLDEILSSFTNGEGSYLGLSKNDIIINYKTGKYEFGETAVLRYQATTYNEYGEIVTAEERTVNYKAGDSINFDGFFTLTITDGNGNKSSWTFTRLGSYVSVSEWSLKNEYFTAPQNYSVKLPIAFGAFNIEGQFAGKYSAEKRYMFASNERAISFAFDAEYAVCVIKQNNRWLYRPSNQGIQIAYTDEALLNQKILSIVTGYIKATDEFSIGGKPYITRGTDIVMDNELLYNGNYLNVNSLTVGGIEYNNVLLVDKNYIFKQNNTYMHASNIVLKHLESGQTYAYKKGSTIADITGGADGLYEVRETLSSYELIYYVYIDNVAPSAEVQSQKAGENDSIISETITTADEIVYQVKTFAIAKVFDTIDNFSLVSISGKGISSVFVNNYPVLNYDNGYSGEYTISIFDRSGNNFNFKVYIMSTPPNATISTYGSGSEEYAVISISYPKHCVAMGLGVTHNTKPLLADDEGISIDATVTTITVKKGGRYAITILDNYNRTTTIDLKYTKDMPDIYLSGVKAGGITNKNVTITVPQKALFSITFSDGTNVAFQENQSGGNTLLTVFARDDNNGFVNIKVWYESDPDAYNDTIFTIDTIPPDVRVINDEGREISGTVNETVFIDYEVNEVKEVYYRLNGSYRSYTKGQGLSVDGIYEVVAKDHAGNETLVSWVTDMHVQYSVSYDKTHYSNIEAHEGKQVIVTRSFLFLQEEQASIEATMDGYSFSLDWGVLINTNGLYIITLTDNVGNTEVLPIRVISVIENIRLEDENETLLAYGSITNKNIRLIWSELSYVKDVSVKVGSTTDYSYVNSELISKEGAGLATLSDVIGNTLKIPFTIDKTVDADFKYNKSFALNGKTLTLDFSISANEPVTVELTHNGVASEYSLGEKIIANGEYVAKIRDNVGNEILENITVIGEREPNVRVLDIDGNTVDANMFNHSFRLDWSDESYLDYVKVNNVIIERGEVFVSDGKYVVEIRDLLGRTNRLVLTIKTAVDYTVTYTGSFLTVRDDVEVILTRGWRAYAGDDSVLTVYKDGELYDAAWGKTVNEAGNYRVVVVDSLGNSDEFNIIVQTEAMLPKIVDLDGNVLADGMTVKAGFNIEPTAFIAEIKVNYSSFTGDMVTKDGQNRISITDVIGNTATLFINIDNTVNYSVSYKGNYDKNGTVLTKGFFIRPNETINVILLFNDAEIPFVEGSVYDETGLYRVYISDEVGNYVELNIEVDNRIPTIKISGNDGTVITEEKINKAFVLYWNDDDNIATVTVNNTLAYTGNIFTESGQYVITITHLLGGQSTRKISIVYDVKFDIVLNGEYVYDAEGKTVTLTKSARISGDSLIYEVTKDGMAYEYKSNSILNESGIYHIIMHDTVGNKTELYLHISSSGFIGNIIANGELIPDKGVVKTPFSIVGNEYINEILVDGERYISGEILGEGRHIIDFLDVLGRKVSVSVTIDYTVEYGLEYAFIDGNGRYVMAHFKLNVLESAEVYLFRDGEDVEIIEKLPNGQYTLTITDAVGNSVSLIIFIDNSPPLIEVSETYTNKDINVKVYDSLDCVVTVYKDNKIIDINILEFTLTEDGKYKILVKDALGNTSEATATIKKIIKITTNFTNGQSVNFAPKISTTEKVKYALYLNGSIVENYELGGKLSEIGEYRLELVDELDNKQVLTWYFMGAQKKFAKTFYRIPENCKFEVYRNNVLADYSLNELGELALDTDGKYAIHLYLDGREYLVAIEIDVTPPNLYISGNFKDKSRGTGEVKISCDSTYEVYFNGVLQDNKPNTLKKVGKYKIVATDDVGNIVEHEFEIYYSPDAVTWILILISIFVGFCILIAIFKRFNILIRIKNNINKKTEEKRK